MRTHSRTQDQEHDYFFEESFFIKLQTQTSLRMRKKMVRIWYSIVKLLPTDKIFDVGATPDCERVDSNCMIPMFQEKTKYITLCSPEEIEHLSKLFRDVEFRTLNSHSDKWPAENREFDYITSSAVLEHVGDSQQQINFIRESGRIANKGIFLTTPNRWHFLEFHTMIPLTHWLPKSWHRWILRRVGLDFWSKEEHLNLLGPRGLEKLAKKALGDEFEVVVKKVWFLFMPSNLLLIAQRKNL